MRILIFTLTLLTLACGKVPETKSVSKDPTETLRDPASTTVEEVTEEVVEETAWNQNEELRKCAQMMNEGDFEYKRCLDELDERMAYEEALLLPKEPTAEEKLASCGYREADRLTEEQQRLYRNAMMRNKPREYMATITRTYNGYNRCIQRLRDKLTTWRAERILNN